MVGWHWRYSLKSKAGGCEQTQTNGASQVVGGRVGGSVWVALERQEKGLYGEEVVGAYIRYCHQTIDV